MPKKTNPSGKQASRAQRRPKEPSDIIANPEVGHPTSTAEAIRQKLRLYPQAMAREIVAMFELEGIRITAAQVQRMKHELAAQ